MQTLIRMDFGSNRSMALVITHIFLAMNSSGEKRMFAFNIPTGFKNKAQGCGTPLPWVRNRPNSRLPQRGYVNWGTVLENRRNSVGVEKREGKTSLTQGSGVPQPWATLWNPVGILNIYVSITIPYPERKDVANDKIYDWERAEKKGTLFTLQRA